MRSADRLPLVGDDMNAGAFRRRAHAIERARALAMDPDDYERCLRAWVAHHFGSKSHVPLVWDERND